jgi:Tol biopolymer transport system component
VFTSGAVLVMLLTAASASATFPGKNGRIAFTSNQDIYSVNPDGTGLTQLTQNGNSFLGASLPRWSPDGQRLVYRQDVPVCGPEHDDLCDPFPSIRVMNADGTGKTELLRTFKDVTSLTWSADGSKIAFASAPPFSPFDLRISVMNGDGSDLTELTRGNYPAWSPDGSRIAFIDYHQVRDHGNFEVFTIRPDGTGLTRLTHSEPRELILFEAPSWSPDGSRLVFFMERPDRDLFTVNADGTGFRNITNSTCFLPEGACELFPVWSPDGTKILFTKLVPISFATVNPDGSDLVRLDGPGMPYSVLSPIDWQPLPGPSRSDYRNAAKFCAAEHEFWGQADFRAKYGTNGNGANAFGKCVAGSH